MDVIVGAIHESPAKHRIEHLYFVQKSRGVKFTPLLQF